MKTQVDTNKTNITSIINTKIPTAKSEAIKSAASDATTKANKALSDAKTYANGLASNYTSSATGTSLQNQINTINENKYFKYIEASKDGTPISFDISSYTEAVIYMVHDYNKISSTYFDLRMMGDKTYTITIGGIIGTYGMLGILDFSRKYLGPRFAFVNSQNSELASVVFYVYAK